eukprot:CAMPEP_0119128198 /NCGR_PEP_ID=MMETSP1310-20130426/6446_1 /TAXON_ID=464262 /ORGANISM="Genus nov. species nov., Strain RCC2339" /LENGTH=388 /DNA_ID=CAMNT_0007118513 /DNA_START=62 /DNA_END=1225 /DNA_ORIENTATION=-
MLVVKALFLLTLLSGSFAVNLAELQGLYDLYNGLDGPNWVDNANWLTGDPCVDAWFGISCSANTSTGHVRGVQLGSNHLAGELPVTITNLYDCEDLSLSQNNIGGPIPEEISVMRNLATIYLQNNSLSSSIPDTLGTLLEYNLQALNFSTNQLSGFVPEFFSSASTELFADLSNNPFYCPLPDNVEYTGASCLNLTIEHIDTSCMTLLSPELEVYGTGFEAGTQALECVLEYNEIRISAPAYIVSDSLLLCPLPERLDFGGCTGLKGQRMVELFHFYLSSLDYIVSNIISSVPVLNPSCSYPGGMRAYIEGQDSYIGSVSIPDLYTAIRICDVGLTNPYRCPPTVAVNATYPYGELDSCRSTFNAYPVDNDLSVIDPNCTEDDPLCMW